MKKFIRWLANVSGVESDIRVEAYKQAGQGMQEYSYWWSGGIMYSEPLMHVHNAFLLYSRMLKAGHHGAVGGSAMSIRDEVYKKGSERIEH